MKKIKWSIIGAGNGGQALAGHLGMIGYEVNIYDPFDEVINVIKEQGGIKIGGIEEGFGKVKLATTDIKEAIEGTDIIMVINPSIYHRSIAEKCAPYIKKEQIVFLHPGATFGAFAFKKALEDFGFKEDITIAESNTLIYAVRSPEAGKADILGKKNRILVSALPANKTDEVVKLLKEVYEEVEATKNVLATSIDNTNPVVHCAPTIFSASWIESDEEWYFYHNAISETVGKFVQKIDDERLEIGRTLGLVENEDLFPVIKQYEIEYNVKKDTISEAVKNTEAYKDLKGPKSLYVRYLLEDIPMGLIPLASIGKLLGVKTEYMDITIKIAEMLLEKDLHEDARTVENLGLEGMDKEAIIEFATTGRK